MGEKQGENNKAAEYYNAPNASNKMFQLEPNKERTDFTYVATTGSIPIIKAFLSIHIQKYLQLLLFFFQFLNLQYS